MLYATSLNDATTPGAYDINDIRRAIDAVSPVTYNAASYLIMQGLDAINQANSNASGGWFSSDLPGGTARNEVLNALQRHQTALDATAPTSDENPNVEIYPDGDDLKRWVMQAYIEYNAVAEGNETLRRARTQFFRDFLDGLRNIIPNLALSFLPGWVWVLGAAVGVISLGFTVANYFESRRK